jgi:hypothetical protein
MHLVILLSRAVLARSLLSSYQSNLKECYEYLHKRQALVCVMHMSFGTMKMIGLKQDNRAKTAMWPT